MKALVIGANGQVGKAVMRLLGDEAIGTAHTRAVGKLIPLDLADIGAVGRLIAAEQPSRIYVPGGVTAVDWCETHEAEARRICIEGTIAVREAAEAIGAHVVFSLARGAALRDDPRFPIRRGPTLPGLSR